MNELKMRRSCRKIAKVLYETMQIEAEGLGYTHGLRAKKYDPLIIFNMVELQRSYEDGYKAGLRDSITDNTDNI